MPCTSAGRLARRLARSFAGPAGRSPLRDARGSVTVEFALIAPVVVLIIGALLVVGVFQTRMGVLNMAVSVAVEQIAHGMPQQEALGQLDQLHPGGATLESGPSRVCLRVESAPSVSGVPSGLGWLLAVLPAAHPILECASRVP